MGMFSVTRGAFNPHGQEPQESERQRSERLTLESHAAANRTYGTLEYEPSTSLIEAGWSLEMAQSGFSPAKVCQVLNIDPETLEETLQSFINKHGSLIAVPDREVASTLRRIIPDDVSTTPKQDFLIRHLASHLHVLQRRS